MNPKIEKVEAEIEKTKAKLATLQLRLRDLERQKTELENAEIVALFRSENLTEGEFAAFIRSMRSNPAPGPGQFIKQEDIEYEK